MRYFFLIVAYAIYSTVFSQINKYVEGYVIKGGDTLKGYVSNSRSPWNVNQVILKKSKRGKDKQIISSKDISAYYFKSSDEFYVKHIVDIDKSTIEVRQLMDDQPMITKRDTVFLQLIVGGEINLYLYYDFKRHFFVEKDQVLQELLLLKYTRSNELSKAVITRPIYKEQLKKLLNVCTPTQKIDFNFASLKQNVKTSNLCKSKLSYVRKSEKPKLNFGIMGGLGQSSMSYVGLANGDMTLDQYQAQKRSFNAQQIFSYGAFIDVYLRQRSSLSFNTELIFRPDNYFYATNGITYNYDRRMDYTIHTKYSLLNLGLKCRLFQSESFALLAKGNFSIPFFSVLETYQTQTINGTQTKIDPLANFDKSGYGYSLAIQANYKSLFLQLRLDNIVLTSSQHSLAQIPIATPSVFLGFKVK